MPHIFVSYAHEDSEFAAELIDELKKANFSLWIDSEQLRAGKDWRNGIDDGIRRSFVLILIMTPEAKESEYVTYEWAFALGIDVPVIPLLFKPTQLHARLEVLQYLDFTKQKIWNYLITQLQEYEKEYALRKNIKVSFIQDTQDQTEYLLNAYQKARKIPDHNTLSFLQNVLGWSGDFLQVSSAELDRLRGEPIIKLEEWDRKRPRTAEEDRKDKVQACFTADWDYHEKLGEQKIVFRVRNISNNNLLVKHVKFMNIHNSFSEGDISSSYIRTSSYYILKDDIESGPKSIFEVDMLLTRIWQPNEIGRIRNKIGFLVLEVTYEGYEVEVIISNL